MIRRSRAHLGGCHRVRVAGIAGLCSQVGCYRLRVERGLQTGDIIDVMIVLRRRRPDLRRRHFVRIRFVAGVRGQIGRRRLGVHIYTQAGKRCIEAGNGGCRMLVRVIAVGQRPVITRPAAAAADGGNHAARGCDGYVVHLTQTVSGSARLREAIRHRRRRLPGADARSSIANQIADVAAGGQAAARRLHPRAARSVVLFPVGRSGRHSADVGRRQRIGAAGLVRCGVRLGRSGVRETGIVRKSEV